ncbi:MAG: S8 family serine peptidase [Bacteroidota bacterium]
MKNHNISLSTFFIFLFHLSYFAQQNDHVPGQFIVQVNDLAELDKIFYISGGKNTDTKKQFKVNQILSERMKIVLLEADTNLNQNILLEKLNSTNGVTLAQFNHYTHDRINIPNDTYFSSMWALNNTGQNGGLSDADIDAPEAWDISTGGLTSTGDTIVVAVIDGGFQLSHPDISFWKNYNEIPGNSIDDDGNGYVDDVNGWNAIGNNASITSNSHGTHVAGTIGAKGNSGTGTTGISWNVKVMAVQGSSSNEAAVVRAYDYVLSNRILYDQTNGQKGAFVVATNSSFGVDQGQPTNYPIWCAMYDSLGAAGILSAGATANQNWNIDVINDIPTGCSSPHLISVTNTTNQDIKYTSAGYGINTIDIGAPGTNIYSTIPTSNWAMNNWIGTSMATPHVAGTIALMYSAACQQFMLDYKNDPAGKSIVMRDFLLNGVDTLSSLSNLCSTGGRLNAYKALLNVQSYSSCLFTSLLQNEKNVEKTIHGIYPNPASEFCEIEYVSDEDNFEIILIDMLGNTVKRISRFNHKGLNRHIIGLEGLSAGVYNIFIESKNGRSKSARIVTY